MRLSALTAKVTPGGQVRRALVLLVPGGYVLGGALSQNEGRPLAYLTILVAAFVALLGSRTPSDTPLASEAAANPSRSARARAWLFAATAAGVATSALSVRAPWAAGLREALAVIATIHAGRAIEGIAHDAGLAPRGVEAMKGPSPKAIARVATVTGALAWGAAAVVDLGVWIGVMPSWEESAPVLAAACGAIGIFALGGGALVIAGARRLELGAPPRALACAAAAGIALVATLVLSFTNTTRPDAALAAMSGFATLAIARLAATGDPIVIARRGRRALALTLFGGPIVMLVAITGGLPAVVLAALAMLVGALVHKLEEPLLPAKGRMLEALAEAAKAARNRESRAAIATALARVREAAGHGATHAELWMLHPTRVCTVDAAGYLQEKELDLPPLLLDVAREEPDATLRTDVLRALEVRRPDLRPLFHWLQDRGALFATLVLEGDEPDGVLIVPAGERVDPLSIEEVREARHLADAFVAICQARSAHQRHLARERGLATHVETLEDILARVRHDAGKTSARNALATARLARAATVGMTSAASRLSYDAIERRFEADAPLTLVAPPGIDPVPFIARAHLGGRRKDHPFVVVDGTSTREHDLARWKDEATSPLALADRGVLVLLDGAALPRDVQVLVARCLTERRPPWERAEPLDILLAFTATTEPQPLVEDGRLGPELFARLADTTPIVLPRLSERAEDLFSIVADRLAREGLRVRGRPVGLDAGAFSRLVEYPFEGEEGELASIVTRLVKNARGDVVRGADVDALRISPSVVEEAPKRPVSVK